MNEVRRMARILIFRASDTPSYLKNSRRHGFLILAIGHRHLIDMAPFVPHPLPIPKGSSFPVSNIPFGIFSTSNSVSLEIYR